MLASLTSDWGHAVALALPSVLLIPYAGLAALPLGVRAVFSLTLAATVTPGLVGAVDADVSWFAVALSGLPNALAACAAIWAATMSGNFLQAMVLTSAESPDRHPARSLTNSYQGTSLSSALTLAIAAGFLELGGPARIAKGLKFAGGHSIFVVTGGSTGSIFAALAQPLVSGISIAVTVAAPVLAVQIVTSLVREAMSGLTRPSRELSPLSGLAALLQLVIVALVLDRVIEHLLTFLHQQL